MTLEIETGGSLISDVDDGRVIDFGVRQAIDAILLAVVHSIFLWPSDGSEGAGIFC